MNDNEFHLLTHSTRTPLKSTGVRIALKCLLYFAASNIITGDAHCAHSFLRCRKFELAVEINFPESEKSHLFKIFIIGVKFGIILFIS